MESPNVNIPSLTVELKDYLTALPAELQHMIIGYLYATHDPNKASHEPSYRYHARVLKKDMTAGHPLDYLAATCKSLRGETMAWARIFLRKHQEITKYKALKTAKLQRRRNFLRGRSGLLTWSELHCVFCGKKSARSAMLMNGLHCCAPCDGIHWPNKIEKNEAKIQYHLKDHHLLPSSDFTPSLARLIAMRPGGLPKLRYGTYVSYNVTTTMFLREDVEALAKVFHGDLKNHSVCEQAVCIEQRRRREEAKARRDSEKAEMILKALELHSIFAPHREDRVAWLTTPAPVVSTPVLHDQSELGMSAAEANFVQETGIEFGDDPFMGGMDLSGSLETWC